MFDIVEPVSAFTVYSQINKQNDGNKQNGESNRQKRKHHRSDKDNLNRKKYKSDKSHESSERQKNGSSGKQKNKDKPKEDVKIQYKHKDIVVQKNAKIIEPKTKSEKIEVRSKQNKVRTKQNDVHIKQNEVSSKQNKVGTKQKEKNKVGTKQKEKIVPVSSNIAENGIKLELDVLLKPSIDQKKDKVKNDETKIIKTPKIIIPKGIKPLKKCSSGYFYVDNANSVKAGEQMFKWILSPLKIDKFFKENWEKTPIIVQRNTQNYYNNLLSCEDIDKALRKQNLHFTKNIDITSYDAKTGVRETHNPPGRATAPLVWDFYANECSIRILNPQTFFPKIHALNAALQEYFECFVGANVYLTPADSQGFAPHYDDIEAFVIQLEGEKLWKLYAPRSASEVLPRFSSGNFTEADLGPPIQEVLLKAGDLMYFPRGFIHQGVALNNKHSLHITLSVYQKNSWADLLEILLPAALKSAIEEDVSFRQGLPMHFLTHLGLVHSDKSSDIRNNFMKTFEKLVSKLVRYAPVDAAVDQLGKKFVHDSLPPFLRHDEKETTVFGDGETITNGVVHSQAEMCLASRVKLVRYNCIRMLREDDSIRIYYSISNSKEYHQEDPQFLEIDEDLAPAIDAIINSYPDYITVEDLPINDDIAKVQIASDLWENGILKTEYPLSYLSD